MLVQRRGREVQQDPSHLQVLPPGGLAAACHEQSETPGRPTCKGRRPGMEGERTAGGSRLGDGWKGVVYIGL